jgi:cyclopropane-fatty-acyl-phospholipid synthase
MTPTLDKKTKKVSNNASRFIKSLANVIEPRNFTIRLWDGTLLSPAHGEISKLTIQFHDPFAIRKMFWSLSSFSLGEAYIVGSFDVEGSIREIFPIADSLVQHQPGFLQKIHHARMLLSIPKSTISSKQGWKSATLNGDPWSPKRVNKAINFHYDLPAEFWQQWLDKEMVYSCAYFRSPENTLDIAQVDKLDYICRKLRLCRGETLLDMGCGWGGLIVHATKYYGVKALGVTLSPNQAEYVCSRIKKEKLEDRSCVRVCDFRDVKEKEPFDKIASVGAVEHVPESRLQEYFQLVWNLLKPGGLFFNQGITRNPTRPLRPGKAFLDNYIFPDHHLVTIGETLEASEQVGFEVRDVENLREHYVSTLEHWHDRLDANQGAVEQITNPMTFRAFKLYLAGTAHEFCKGRVHLQQSLFFKLSNTICTSPRTRSALYSA